MVKSGKFITLEGGEGAGKSTQISYLRNFLESRGVDVVVTREPGGSEGGELIRQMVVRGATHRWEPLTEYLLFSAARHDHIEKIIKPALGQGKWVICDRFFDSSLAYQGAGGGVNETVLRQIYQIIAPNFAPDITYVFDLPLENSFQRVQKRSGSEERFEQMPLAFHQRVRKKFLALCQEYPERCVLIDAQKTIHEISQILQDHLDRYII